VTEDDWGLYNALCLEKGLRREVLIARHKIDFLSTDSDLTESSLLYALDSCADHGWIPKIVHSDHGGIFYTREVREYFGLGYCYYKDSKNDRWWVECEDGYRLASRGA
jgi:hypothetical protein